MVKEVDVQRIATKVAVWKKQLPNCLLLCLLQYPSCFLSPPKTNHWSNYLTYETCSYVFIDREYFSELRLSTKLTMSWFTKNSQGIKFQIPIVSISLPMKRREKDYEVAQQCAVNRGQ